MADCGHGDGGSLDPAKQILHAGEGRAAKLGGHGLGLRGIRVHNSQQIDTESLLLQFVVDASVVSAERAHTNDCHPDWTFVSHAVDFLRAGTKQPRLSFAPGGTPVWDAPSAL